MNYQSRYGPLSKALRQDVLDLSAPRGNLFYTADAMFRQERANDPFGYQIVGHEWNMARLFYAEHLADCGA